MKLVLVFCLISTCFCLFEDQVGKFDWRKQFIGCPREAFFNKIDKIEQLVVATRENVIAAISTSTGELNWRRIQEEHESSPLELIQAKSKRLYTVSDAGRVVRAWNTINGAVLWQKAICETTSSNAQLALPSDASQGVYVYSCGNVFHLSAAGEELWKINVETTAWTRLAVNGNEVRIISLEQGLLTVKVIIDGKLANTKTASIKGNAEKCLFSGKHVICAHSEEISAVDITASILSVKSINTGVAIRELLLLDSENVVARSPSSAIVFNLPSLTKVLDIGRSVDAAALADKKLVTISGNVVLVYDLISKKEVLSKTIPHEVSNPVTKLFVRAQQQSVDLFAVFSNCRTEFIEISLTAQSLELEWVKEEGLARVAAVEMIDLPLSESQQLIEDEFDEKSSNILSAFLHRTVSQLIQLQRWLVHTIKEIVTLSESITYKGSFSQILDSVKASSRVSGERSLERDYFNLRKMLIVASLDGVVFGIDSADGRIVWRTNLGVSFTPLKNSLGEHKIPLFIQRSTSNYHLDGQAVVVFKDSFSDQGVLFVFNPITGAVVERKNLNSNIIRVDLLPFAGKDQIHSLVLVDTNEKVSFYPELPHGMELSHPIYILAHTSSNLSGKQVNFKTRSLDTVWTSNIHLSPSEKIILIKGKPATQKVHSQGRVLIDRNVQYKYSNPNLVAVASLDSVNQVLTIYLVDVVSGLLVHTAKLPRASGPVHLVHCENWVAYSYWSEKTRRTEIGVIELYEGETQNNKEKFDSLSPTSKAPEIVTQSYVYAQGIDAMAISETEQGLTTRSIILALPFGGLHEVSRKLLDANRPYELTQEMKEEGMIPYMPELPIATEEMVNYNQTVFRVKGIKTASSGLESTSLMLAYGIDLFFTRLHPSGTFDILKDDFDHVLISLVLVGLFLGSFISKRISRNNALKASWA